MENKNLILFPVLIPTEDASHLMLSNIKDKEPELVLSALERKSGAGWNSQHIYLCSSERGTQGDWVLRVDTKEIHKIGFMEDQYYAQYWKKIILTTKKRLISDGVLPIDGNTKAWIPSNNKNPVFTNEMTQVNFLEEFVNRWNEHEKYERIFSMSEKEIDKKLVEFGYDPDKVGQETIEFIKKYQKDMETHARNFSGLKKGVDMEDEKYYNSQTVKIYEAFIQGWKTKEVLQSNAGKFSEYDIHTAINMARGITFKGNEHNYHHTNAEIVEYVKSLQITSASKEDEKCCIDECIHFSVGKEGYPCNQCKFATEKSNLSMYESKTSKGEIVIECEMEGFIDNDVLDEGTNYKEFPNTKIKLENGQPIINFK